MTNRFLIFGLPRTGTTYLGHLFNAHPACFCGQEAFPPHKLEVDDFAREHFENRSYTERARKHARDTLSKKSDPLVALGDKFPRSYFSPHHYSRNLRKASSLFTVRRPGEVFASFDQRADDPSDGWHRGMRWPVAYLEYQVSFRFLLDVTKADLRVIGYRYLMEPETREEAATRVLSHAGLDRVPQIDGFLSRSLERTVRSLQRERRYSALQERLFEARHMKLLDTLCEQAELVSLDSFRADIRNFLEAVSEERELIDEIWREILDDPELRQPLMSLLRDKGDYLERGLGWDSRSARHLQWWKSEMERD